MNIKAVLFLIVVTAVFTVLNASDFKVGVPLWSLASASNTSFLGNAKVNTEKHHMTTKTTAKSSIECLSCHDGVDAQNATLSSPRVSVALRALTGSKAQHHPVSILYVEGKAGLRPKNTALIGTWSGAATISDLLVDGKIECSSCHEPHALDPDTDNLRNANRGSILCSSCHDK